ncbi:hypothetical protein DTB58_06110 [Streptomyces griseus]|nr:hypothetical protein [Streptomyces griseus]
MVTHWLPICKCSAPRPGTRGGPGHGRAAPPPTGRGGRGCRRRPPGRCRPAGPGGTALRRRWSRGRSRRGPVARRS